MVKVNAEFRNEDGELLSSLLEMPDANPNRTRCLPTALSAPRTSQPRRKSRAHAWLTVLQRFGSISQILVIAPAISPTRIFLQTLGSWSEPRGFLQIAPILIAHSLSGVAVLSIA